MAENMSEEKKKALQKLRALGLEESPDPDAPAPKKGLLDIVVSVIGGRGDRDIADDYLGIKKKKKDLEEASKYE